MLQYKNAKGLQRELEEEDVSASLSMDPVAILKEM